MSGPLPFSFPVSIHRVDMPSFLNHYSSLGWLLTPRSSLHPVISPYAPVYYFFFCTFMLLPPHDPIKPLPSSTEVSPRRRILNVSRSVWKQANVASDLWEKLTARCVDRHRLDSFICNIYIKYLVLIKGGFWTGEETILGLFTIVYQDYLIVNLKYLCFSIPTGWHLLLPQNSRVKFTLLHLSDSLSYFRYLGVARKFTKDTFSLWT